ncbi:MAG: DUF2939 domain-containing protein [Bauldia sp.]|nr:DUF2939 domain-containing protein [Bauldia sp.]
MRRPIVIGLVILVVAAGFLAWPVVNLYQLVNTVRSRDKEAFEAQVDLPAIRLSLARQFLALAGEGKVKGVAVSVDPAGQAIFANLIAARLDTVITPEAIFDLLRRGRIGDGDGQSSAKGDPLPNTLPGNPLSQVRGLRFSMPPAWHVTVGERDDPGDWLTVVLTLRSNLVWQLTDVILPERVFRRLGRDMQLDIRSGG